MPDTPPGLERPSVVDFADRRAPAAAPGIGGLLRRLSGLLRRPLGLERRGLQVHVVLVERRRTPSPHEPPSVDQQCNELRARLLAQDHDRVASAMRQLAFVHDELRRKGWPGVEALSSHVLGHAVAQARQLASDEPAPVMAGIVDRLRLLAAAAALREERQISQRPADRDTSIEVSEASYGDYEETERGWLDTVAPEPARSREAAD